MSEKTKLKDLATELGKQAKDLVTAAKELGFQNKNQSSTLTESEVAGLKTHFAPEKRADSVIVRRRSKSDAPAMEEVTEKIQEAPEVAAPADADAEQARAKSRKPVKTVEAEEGEAGQTAPAEKTARPERAPKPAPAAGARIISRPNSGAEAAHAPAEEAPAAERPAPVKIIEPAPAQAGQPAEEAVKEAQKAEAAKAPTPVTPAVPGVPTGQAATAATGHAGLAANLSAEPERSADGRIISSAPVLAPRPEKEAGQGAGREQAFDLFGDDEDDDARGNRKKAPRQEAPASQVRVISRPAPSAAPRAGEGYHDRSAPGRTDNRSEHRPGGPGAPGAAGGHAGHAGQGAGGHGGQGRPDYRPGGNRPGGFGGHAGPGGQGGPGGPRPDNRPDNRTDGRTDSRPPFNRGPRPGGAPAGGHDNAARPPRPDSRPPFTPAGGEGTDASRDKKRAKGRRTVDFAGGKDAVGRRFKDGDGDGMWNRNPRKGKGKKGQDLSASTQPIKAAKRKIRVDEFIRVSDLAHQMGLKTSEIIKVLFGLGVMATINQTLDIDTATLVASEFDYEVEKVGFSEQDFLEDTTPDNPENLVIRPPVVTIMGHVDHGKTSLLDAIRKSSVASGEAGGITQHIGAYHVKTRKGDIVFLDTPGHAAFTAMRARGAEVTDIVVLVVAADDGVMEQTKEAVSHAKAAGVPIMVAVNKMDKPEANPDRVKRELTEQGLVAEDWGGDTVFSLVSAKTREGLDDFLELLALQAEILELKANPNKSARGHIVEAKLDKGRGSLGTVLIQQGTLRVGDPFVCGVHYGRVRAMFDDQGRKVKEAGPSMPVEVQGFEGVPEAGEEFVSLPDEKTARRIADTRAVKVREKALARESKITLETFLSRRADDTQAQTLNLVVKADVQGSLEAIVDALNKLSTSKVRINVVHGGAGAISESDVLLAAASDAIIIGFNVRPATKAKELAEQEKIDIRFYDIIYKLVEEITSAMEGMLAPVSKEVYLGTAEVRETFSVPKVGIVAGCHVSDGKFVRNAQVRLLRDGVVVHTGKLSSLRRFKDDVKEVMKGYECGMGLENYNDIKVGDMLEAFEIVEEAASL